MLRIGLKPKNETMMRLVNEIFDSTKIIKRQPELTSGVWDFVVFGPKSDKSSIVREGFAKDLEVENSFNYDRTNEMKDLFYPEEECIPIENFVSGKIPDELSGLELLYDEPFRSLNVIAEKKVSDLSKTRKMIVEKFKNKNIAIIEAPDEAYWAISVLKYLNECDQYFPDSLNLALRYKLLEYKGIGFDYNMKPPSNGSGGAIIN